MLQIVDISKEYRTGTLVQRALNHVSLNLRENEFVAILGPSGSGKTTLLNIIGGLDRYDSGDLIINGISTENYSDRDWDSYRNHTIGFVFQSYNLIPHQTVLANVELALTISGISRAERKERAIKSLEEVGLGDQLHKKPNQMSGGQMQRVAIARALVNDPDILLADEPTGALDSDTSVQVMELLKEVAKDRLVVMVTHNPELAETYATRIVTLKDGVITSDTDPFIVDETKEAIHQNMGHASMSFLTALSLSFNNLKTKLTRTILVSFAGSIGIIGIALILSLSNGANKYIHDIEEETLSEYPVQIQTSAFDFTSMMMASGSNVQDNYENAQKDVHEVPIVNGVFSRTRANDLGSLRNYLEYESRIYDYANAVEYSYSVEPQIYRIEGEEYRQVNPDSTFSSLGFGGSSNSLLSMAMSTNIFHALPQNPVLYENQYEVKAGRWPNKYNECVVVTFESGGIYDFALYALGLKDSSELDKLVEQFVNEEDVTVKSTREEYNYEDFIGINFKIVSSADYYSYDDTYNVWVDKHDDKKYMRDIIRYGEDLTVVGVVQVKENAEVAMLTSGIYYPYELISHIIKGAEDNEITQKQINQPSVNVFTGKRFDDTEEPSFDMESLFSIDTSLLSNAFKFDNSKLNIDPSMFSNLSNMDLSSSLSPEAFQMDPSSMPSINIEEVMKELNIKVNSDQLDTLFETFFEEYLKYASSDPKTDYATLPQAFGQYMQDPEVQQELVQMINQMIEEKGGFNITNEDITEAVNYILEPFPQYMIDQGYTDPEQIATYIMEYLQTEQGQTRVTEALAQLQAKLGDIELTEEDIQKILTTLSEGYEAYAKEHNLPDPELLSKSLMDFMSSKQGQKILSEQIPKVVNTKEIEAQVTKIVERNMAGVSTNLANTISSVMQNVMSQVVTQIANTMQNAMGSMASNMANAISFDADVFTRAFSMNMSEEDLQELMMSMFNNAQETYDNNLKKLGYADLAKPSMISIYPKDFDSKNEIIHLLDSYNDRMREEDENKVIRYTDTVGTLMSSVTTIIDTISYVLVAFVAISLVVSSIMIGVITYISVLERKKEIGILRAIGASKRNISEVFNAETFIIGLLAGLFGVGITQLILIPGNQLIHHLSNNPNINAFLPWNAAIILVILSVVLTLIGGLIPSRKAAKSDPVTALRTE